MLFLIPLYPCSAVHPCFADHGPNTCSRPSPVSACRRQHTILAAREEERLTPKEHLQGFPKLCKSVSPKLWTLSELDYSNLNTVRYTPANACAWTLMHTHTHTQWFAYKSYGPEMRDSSAFSVSLFKTKEAQTQCFNLLTTVQWQPK